MSITYTCSTRLEKKSMICWSTNPRIGRFDKTRRDESTLDRRICALASSSASSSSPISSAFIATHYTTQVHGFERMSKAYCTNDHT